ncbi:MAG: DUF4124 domain-containing protein [Legionellaceae bacterium]|nr:DUF4124 domain-containing protein [Legionellaceae bacterium]
MIKASFCMLWILVLTVASHAAIYRWVDKNGVVHFSDKPRKGAEPVHLAPLQTYSPVPASITPTDDDHGNDEKKALYQSLDIVDPENESTLRDNEGRVVVRVELTPALKPGDKIQILLDGQPVGEPETTTRFVLLGVLRGSHSIAAQVVNSKGEVVIQSQEAVTLYMHRPRTGMTGATPPPRNGS